ERRNLAVLARRKPLKPGLARVHDQRIDARTLDRAGERFERLLGILRVDTDPALNGHRHTHLRPHGGDAITDQRRLSHQAGAEAPLLYAVRRAADIEVDLGVAEALPDRGALRERARIAPSELERDRLLGRIRGEKPRTIAMDHRAGRDHLAIEQGSAREQAMEEPTVPVGPVHHRGNGKYAVQAAHFVRSRKRRLPASVGGSALPPARSSRTIPARIGRRSTGPW